MQTSWDKSGRWLNLPRQIRHSSIDESLGVVIYDNGKIRMTGIKQESSSIVNLSFLGRFCYVTSDIIISRIMLGVVYPLIYFRCFCRLQFGPTLSSLFSVSHWQNQRQNHIQLILPSLIMSARRRGAGSSCLKSTPFCILFSFAQVQLQFFLSEWLSGVFKWISLRSSNKRDCSDCWSEEPFQFISVHAVTDNETCFQTEAEASWPIKEDETRKSSVATNNQGQALL